MAFEKIIITIRVDAQDKTLDGFFMRISVTVVGSLLQKEDSLHHGKTMKSKLISLLQRLTSKVDLRLCIICKHDLHHDLHHATKSLLIIFSFAASNGPLATVPLRESNNKKAETEPIPRGQNVVATFFI